MKHLFLAVLMVMEVGSAGATCITPEGRTDDGSLGAVDMLPQCGSAEAIAADKTAPEAKSADGGVSEMAGTADKAPPSPVKTVHHRHASKSTL